FNNFLPSSVGGDVLKAAFLARGQRRRAAAVATVVMDLAIALWGVFWFVALLGGAFWLSGSLGGAGATQSRLLITVAAATARGSRLGRSLAAHGPAPRPPGGALRRAPQPHAAGRRLGRRALVVGVDVPLPAGQRGAGAAGFLGQPGGLRAHILLLRPDPLGR